MVISPLTVALLTAALVAIGDWLHRRRCQRISRLAFPDGAPRPWTQVTPVLRVAATALLAWGLMTLLRAILLSWPERRARRRPSAW